MVILSTVLVRLIMHATLSLYQIQTVIFLNNSKTRNHSSETRRVEKYGRRKLATPSPNEFEIKGRRMMIDDPVMFLILGSGNRDPIRLLIT